MKKHDSSPNYHAPARVKKTNVFTSIVWLIPLIALIAGGWLLVKDIRNRGPVVTLLMDSAEGIEVNNTVIKVLNVDVGRVTRIKLRDDQKRRGSHCAAQRRCQRPYPQRYPILGGQTAYRPKRRYRLGNLAFRLIYCIYTGQKPRNQRHICRPRHSADCRHRPKRPAPELGRQKTTASSTSAALFCMKTLWSAK